MLTREEQALWQRDEGKLVSQLEGALEALVAACDGANPVLENLTGGLLLAGHECEKYVKTLEKARAQLMELKEHRRKFEEAKAVADERKTTVMPPTVVAAQSFEALQHGTNWRDLKGGRR